MDSNEMHQQATEKLGLREYKRLILNERSDNQLHWAKKFNRVLGFEDTPKLKLEEVEKLVDEMMAEAKYYKEEVYDE